jgi:hypothetical protein
MPRPTTQIIDWFRIAMKIQPMQQIADHMARSRLDGAGPISSISRDTRAVNWRRGMDGPIRAIRNLEQLLERVNDSRGDYDFARTAARSSTIAIAIEPGFVSPSP